MVQFVSVGKQFVLACNVLGGNLLGGSYVGTGHRLAGVLEGSSHEPAVLVLEHLVYTYLMTLSQVLETGMIYQIGAAVFCGNDGVMALRTLAIVAFGLVTPVCVGSEDVDTTVAVVFARAEVQQIAAV